MTGQWSYVGGTKLSPVLKDLRIIPATPGGAASVLSDLSQVERDEKERLGLTSTQSIFVAINKGRSFLLIMRNRPYTNLAVFGVGEEGTIWFLPTNNFVTNHKRSLVDRNVIRWVLSYCFALLPANEPLLFNGVSPENTVVLRWLKKAVGATVYEQTQPTIINGHPAHPFIISREAALVRT